MDAFAWNDSFLTGEVQVDAEHRQLVSLINRVINFESAGDTRAVEGVAHELMTYADLHFRHEETLMLALGCDPRHVHSHRAVHLDFAHRIMQMQKGVDTVTLLRFLCSWLVYHILGTDQIMARQLRLIREGCAPAEAFELVQKETPRDPAATSLLTALGDLYGVVLERNEALKTLNDQLENLVIERTMALSRSNEALRQQNAELQELNLRLSETRQQLIQAERLASVGQLAAGVAHEINNPISFVQSNIGALDRGVEALFQLVEAYGSAGLADPADQARLANLRQALELDYLRQDMPELFRESKDGMVRISRIVQDLRTFSQVDSANESKEVDLAFCLDSALNLLEAEFPGRLQIKREYAGLPLVECRVAQINQVFMAILNNAAQAVGEEGGILTVRTAVQKGWVWIEFIDTGVGMTEDVRKRIFDPFFTTRSVGSGMGLGLSVAYGIMQQHGGQIEVHSEPGQGCEIRLGLPLRPAFT